MTVESNQVVNSLPPDDDEVRIAVRCNICRRWLTHPTSVAAGAGARCRGERE